MEHTFQMISISVLSVIEKDFGQDRFLLENPYKTTQSPNIQRVPIIIGIAAYEFVGEAYCR